MNNKTIYQNRRTALTEKYSRTLFVIPVGRGPQRSHSVQYRFKVPSDFYYLTGLQISDAVLILANNHAYLLQDQNLDRVWGEFSSPSLDDANLLQGLHVEPITNLQKVLNDLGTFYDRIAFSFGRDQSIENAVMQMIQFQRRLGRSRNFALNVCDSRTLVGSLRAIKDESEITNLKKAGQKSSHVHQKLLQQKLIGKSERQISNWMEAQFLLEDMQWASYETIVGVGNRSTVLHARATDQIVQDQQLILIDGGAEWKGYCADITRTFPSGSRFTSEQRHIYQIVLDAQKAALALIRPGITLQALHERVFEVFKEKLQTNLSLKRIMPHSTSHWLGLDVHDPCPYLDDQDNPIRLQKGMCFTVEPGLYFNQIEGFEKFNGIGVRIEDDVVVTENGFQFLTGVQKEIDEIEQLRAIGHTF